MSLTPSDDLPINRNPLYNPNPPPSQTYPANQIQIRLTQEAINVDNITSLKFNISYIPYNLAKTTVDITNTLNIIYVNGISLKTAS